MTISAVPVAGRLRAFRWRTAVGLALSLAVHALLLLSLREQLEFEVPGDKNEKERAPLIVELGPPSQSSAPSQPAQAAQPEIAPAPQAPPSAKRKPARPAPIRQAPLALAPQPERPPEPDAQNPPPADLSAMIAARRARRAQTEQPALAESDAGRRGSEAATQGNEIALENIQRSIKQGRGREGTNGLFRILHKGPRSASFSFRGWSTDSSKRWNQVIEVDAGPNGDVERAIVRRMIELIREHHQEDFYWDSRRLGRVVKLSARKADGAGLEEFLLHEFFDNG